MYPISSAFRRGVALRIFLLGIAHPVVGPLSGTGGVQGDDAPTKAVIMKKVDMWP